MGGLQTTFNQLSWRDKEICKVCEENFKWFVPYASCMSLELFTQFRIELRIMLFLLLSFDKLYIL